MRSIFVSNFNGIFNSVVNFLRLKGDFCDNWVDADTLLVWQDVVGNFPDIVRGARNEGKKVYCAEHGLLSINDYIPPLSRPMLSDKYLCWGERTKRWLVEKAGMNPDRIVVTGTTVFDDFRPKILHKGKNVLFAPRHWDYELEENLEIAETLSKLPKEINVYSKIVEGEHDPKRYPNPIPSNRQAGNHLYECWKALSEADVVVTLGEGTFASLAYYMDIPVISGGRWDTKDLLGKVYDRAEFFSQVSGACSIVPISKLKDQVLKEIDNPQLNKEERYKFLVDNVNYGSNALENILKVLYE